MEREIEYIKNIFYQSYSLEDINGVLDTLHRNPTINKAIATTEKGVKISAYRCGSNIVRIDINTKAG